MFAVICVPDFALQAVLRHEPALRSHAIALIDGAAANAKKTQVLQCTEKAQASGVCPGLTAPQAQARCRDLLLKLQSRAAEQSANEILLQTAYTFSPNLEHTASGVCTIDLRGLAFDSSRRNAEHGARSAELSQNIITVARDVAQQSFGFLNDAVIHSPSPLNGERAGVRGGYAECCAHDRTVGTYHPSPSFPLPVEGRGRSSLTLFAAWAAEIISALHKLGLEAKIGIASTPNIALLAAHAAKPLLVIDCVKTFFDALPIAAIEPVPHLFDILKRWGIRTVGAFLALGKDPIAERLGVEALELFHRAATDTIRPLNIVVPVDTFEERMDFEAQIETIEPLLFVLRRFTEQLTTRIALTYRVVAELQLNLTLESGASYERTFKVPAPTTNVETLFRMLHTHLENLRTDAPITSLRLSAMPTRAESQQFGLFESALRDPNHFHETLARLSALLGAEQAGTPVAHASHQPDVFRMQAPQFGERTEIRNPHREPRNPCSLCLRRFRPAILAEVELKQGQPVFISTLLMSARIKRVRGPWCISGTWWDERRWSRQEWDVETEKGELYRLRNVNGDWMLEGVYD